MRGNNSGRGRGGQRGMNSGGSNVPSETIRIRITEIRQPVTEEVMRRVFDSVGVSSRRVDILPSNNPNETIVIAEFADNYSAGRVISSLNNRNIFNDGNKMTMNYEPSRAEAAASVAANAGIMNVTVGVNGGVLSSMGVPQMYNSMPMQPQQVQSLQQFPQQHQQQQQLQQIGNNPVYQQPPMAPHQHHQQFQPQFPDPMMAPQMQAAGIQEMMMPQFPQGTPNSNNGGVVVGGGGLRAGRGRGNRGGAGMGMPGAGFNPMGMMPGFAGAMPFPNAMMPGFPGAPMNAGMPMMRIPGNAVDPNAPTVFLSVTAMPESEPLQSIFVLMEAFGGVVTIRRNHKKKEILTVKMASTEDADAAVRYLRRVPYAGGFVSAKKFASYVERNPCTDDGDANDPATTQFDFTATRHRSPGQRSKASPSNTVKVTGCSAYCEADLMTYFNGKGYYPERILKDMDGTFTIQVGDVDTAVRLLISCHGDVCREERSNVLFVEGPKDQQALGEEGGVVAM